MEIVVGVLVTIVLLLGIVAWTHASEQTTTQREVRQIVNETNAALNFLDTRLKKVEADLSKRAGATGRVIPLFPPRGPTAPPSGV